MDRDSLRPVSLTPSAASCEFKVELALARVAGARRSHPSESVNGDDWLVLEHRDGLLIAIFDGLGHGPHAQVASKACVDSILEISAERQLADVSTIMRICQASAERTRGAAGAILRISQDGLSFAGLGNISFRAIGGESLGVISKPGILGRPGARAMVASWRWPDSGAVVLHSDGLSSRVELPLNLLRDPIEALTRSLLNESDGSRDDASLIVIQRQAQSMGKRVANERGELDFS